MPDWKFTDLELIPHQDLSDEQKGNYEKIMRRGANVIETYHARIKVAKNTRYSKQQFRKDLFKAIKNNNGNIVLHGVGIPRSDIAIILKVKEIEWDVLCGISKLIFQQAAKWSRRNHGCNMQFEDFYDEAVMASVNAIYGYSQQNIRFITYCQHAIHRRILNATNESKPLSPWSQRGKKLYGQFSEMKTKLGQEVSFDEVVKLMRLNDDAIFALRAMLTSAINSSDISDENFDLIEFSTETSDEVANRVDCNEIINSTPMTDWERTVLNAYLHGGHGWATKVANDHINPATNEQYSRRAPKLALDRVLEKIRERYEQERSVNVVDVA